MSDSHRALTAVILGASGFAGGELLRLLLRHPRMEAAGASSRQHQGRPVSSRHPNLRGHSALKFCAAEDLPDADVAFLCQPGGVAMRSIAGLDERYPRIVDLSPDFRLRDVSSYEQTYGQRHEAPHHLSRAVYGLPELHRQALSSTDLVSGVGCNATALNLALLPLVRAQAQDAALVDWNRGIVAEVKVGSSEAGAEPSESSHHPLRSGSVRSYAPIGHRHGAEVLQMLNENGISTELHLSATAVERVRGVQATLHLFARDGVDERELVRAFRKTCGAEPFLRFVRERRGAYRYPDPKVVAGSNYAEVSLEFEPDSRRIVVLSALDNLVKGAAGSALQSANLLLGLDETVGLDFPGLHPI